MRPVRSKPLLDKTTGMGGKGFALRAQPEGSQGSLAGNGRQATSIFDNCVSTAATAKISHYCTDTATTPFTAHGANDNGPYSEEPREGKALTRGSVVGAESAMAPPTIT